MADRYEILEKIGTGGMSDVYKAKDHKLNRFVAVKVLKQEFSENDNFVSKFRVEAQAAAGLMHPNIVNVYDVGKEDGIHYIVMELVEGITLKKYIEKKARLSYKEAISIAIQVCMGIESAHNNHIIHRDIKPQNIIISKEGKVKVTDFGIAKAATSNTITSNVMGSVHYTSPEQARGGFSDEKSDIYSLGITLFEMLTGRVPFNGETTVAIAIKHIQEDMPSPRDFVSEIPVSVEQIVFKCCQKSPDRRYQAMSDVIVDLKKALMNPDAQIVDPKEEEEIGATKTVDDNELIRIKKQAKSKESIEASVNLRTEEDSKKKSSKKKLPTIYEDEEYEDGEYYDDEYDDYPQDEYEEYDEEYDEYEDYDDYEDEIDSKDPKIEKITTIIAVVAAVLIGLIVVFLVARTLGVLNFDSGDKVEEQNEQDSKMVQMISVIGLNAESVKKSLIDIGLTPVIEYADSTDYAEGIVIGSSVEEGDMIAYGSDVVLTVSLGDSGVEVPDVVGMTEAEAVSTLVNKGFVPSKSEGYDDYIREGSIYKQSPDANTKAPNGSTISIFISKGPEKNKISVPSLLGMDEIAAMATLTENNLTLGTVTEVFDDDVSKQGLIVSQSIEAGSFVEAGTVIDINVSMGPELATYEFVEGINGPSIDEDPNFRNGTVVTVTLTAEDGTVLLSTQTSDFPIAAQNITGIKSPTGVLMLQYVNQGESSTITNEDGTVTTVEGVNENKQITRSVSFKAE